MKLKLVAVAVTSLLAAGVVNAAEVYNKDGNKLDLYGKVHAQHYFSDDNGSDGDKTYARLGFKGETQINDQLTGFGQWEYEFKGNRTESQGADKDKTRLAFAGLKFADYGSFDYGRNYGVAYDIGAWTDVLPEFGGDTWTQTDVFMTGRTTGVATYRNTDFFGLVEGLNFAAQYQGKNDRDGAFCCSLNTKPVLSGLAFSLDVDSVIRSMPCRRSLVVVFADRAILPLTSKCWMSMPAIVRCVKNGRVE